MVKIFDSSDRYKNHGLEHSHSFHTNKEKMPDNSSKKTLEAKGKTKCGSQFFIDHPQSSAVLSAFATNPKNINFSTQDHGEQVLLMLRQHPITQVGWVVIATSLVALPTLLGFIGFLDFLPLNYKMAGLIGWYMLVSGYILESLLKWFYNVYIITDERFIDIDFDSLLFKNISAAKIESIQDVTAESKGILAAFFDYGHIYLQTAAEKREFEFLNVPHPQRIKKIINQLILEEEQEKIEGRVR